MKISYISLKKKLEEYTKNIKEKKENINENIERDIKGETKEKINILDNLKKAPKGSYTLMIFMILLLAITTKVNMDTYSKLSEEEYETYKLEENNIPASNSNVVIYKEAVSSVYEVNNDYVESIETTSKNVIESNKDIIEEEKYVYEYSYIRPLSGETMKEYSMDKVIYSRTLDMWKTHDGIDIHANIGDEVKASEKGIVERVYNDSLYGYSVIINHQNGIKTIYRNLDNEITVKENQEIEKETVIGRVGNTAISECKDESHLHFEVVQNTEIVNPSIIGIK